MVWTIIMEIWSASNGTKLYKHCFSYGMYKSGEETALEEWEGWDQV